ncbi:MAG TPA: phosphate ABC transporter permease PstA [Solirubrobacteraceae bacterium]|nr:phosphate ABC transporter permease PstA [Solirubrobacteraceae bacterium]
MTALLDPTAPLTATGNLRRREAISRLVRGCTTAATLIAVAVLVLVVYGVFSRGVSALSLGFLTEDLPEPGHAGGGIGPALLGTAMLALAATLIAMPLGVLIALYASEFAGARVANAIRLVLDLMYGLPTIIIGLFVFGLMVNHHHQSGIAGAVGLSIVMLPLIARSTQEVLALVPHTLREASEALGMSRWRTVGGVVLPAASGGIVTGTILAGARAAGETAPLLLATTVFANGYTLDFFGKAVPNIPIMIFTLSEEASPIGFTRAWGAAFVLLVFILLANIGARALLARSRAKMAR